MSTESTDTTRTASDTDDRSDAVPEGGFAPTVELDDLTSVATMPPPPPGSGAWSAARDAAEPDASHEVPQGDNGHFPPSTSSAHHDRSSAAWAASETAAEDDAPRPRDVTDAGDGVVFFGDGVDVPAPSGWVSDDDPDLILPIEPARFVAWGGAAAAEPEQVAVVKEAPETTSHEVAVEPGGEGATAPEVDISALVDLLFGRLSRVTAGLASELTSFLADDAGEFVAPRLPDAIVCLAGSELTGLVEDFDGELIGASLEIGGSHRVPLGIRFPLELVRIGDETTVTAVGGISLTAVGGEFDVTISFDGRVDDDFADEITRRIDRLAAAANRSCADGSIVVTNVLLDSAGAIRIEVERG